MNRDIKKIVKTISLAVFFLLIIIYAFFRSQDLIFGVKIKNVEISGQLARTGMKIADNVVEITGKAKKAINLTLNGREISIDEENNFNETIALLPGYNIISLRARDKFGYIDEKNYKLIY